MLDVVNLASKLASFEERWVAKKLVECVLFEPASTRNTGEVDHDYTIEPDALERI
jgi:hypothetical protein